MNPNDPNQPQQPGVPTPPQVPQQPMTPQPPAPGPAPGQQPFPQPGMNQPQQPMNPHQPMQVQPSMGGGGGSKKKLMLIVGGAIALLILIVVLILVLGGGSDDAANSSGDETSDSSSTEENSSEKEDGATTTSSDGPGLKTGGPDVEAGYEIATACETGTIPGNLTASSGNNYRVDVYKKSDRFDSFGSQYLILQERNQTDSDREFEVDAVACMTRGSEVSKTINCDFELDDEPIVAKMKQTNFDIKLYDAKSGELIGETTIGSDPDCPFFATIDENNELFASPDEEEGGDKIAELTKGRP